MANSFQGISSGLAELKNIYDGPLKDQFNEDLPFYRAAEKIKKGWSGFQVIRPLRVRRNQGIGATSDGGTLPAIGSQSTVQAIIASKFNYLRFGVTGPMIKASQSRQGSFVEAASYELDRGYEDLKSDCNRQYTWDGTGDLALVNTTLAGSTSLVIKGRESTEAALKFVDVGLVFDVYSGSTLVASGVSVTAISGAPTDTTATLTLSAPISATAGDVLVRSGSGVTNEIQGALYSMDGGTGTIYEVNRTTYPAYQGNSQDCGSNQLSLDRLQNSYNEALRRGNGKLSAIYSDFDSLRYYQKLLTPDKRYVNQMKGDGGFASNGKSYLEFNGLPWVADKDCPTRIMMLSQDAWKNYVLADLEFADETGSMYIAQTSADSLEVRIRFFSNLFNDQPSANSILKTYISP